MSRLLAKVLLALGVGTVAALPTDDTRSYVPFHQPDAWAMAYVAASTLMTGYGTPPQLDAGAHAFSVELGHVPRLSTAEQRVGLGGIKQEDLNKSPLVGRARWWLGLPRDLVLELGWVPPLEIDGAQPEDLFSAALSRRWIDHDRWALSTRVHAQTGAARGDVTCPAEVAAHTDPLLNPFRCLEPSRDRIALGQYGLEVSAELGATARAWRSQVTLGWLRMEPEVRIHAEQRGYHNRSSIVSSGSRPYLALGLAQQRRGRWDARVELLYLPLRIRRPDQEPALEPYWSLRLMLRRFGRSD